jgi:hypothetical protein
VLWPLAVETAGSVSDRRPAMGRDGGEEGRIGQRRAVAAVLPEWSKAGG